MKKWVAKRASIMIVVAFLIMTFAQLLHGQDEKPWQFPEALRSELDSRLRAFTDAQAAGDWHHVSELLGRYRRAGNYMLYTSEHRACLIDKMKQLPMIGFQYAVWDRSFSSEILSTPPEKRWWTLVGDATYRRDGKEVKKQVYLVAYRDQGKWFFTPPPIDNDDAVSHFNSERLKADLANQVALRAYSGSPIEVVDLHVFIDKDNVLSRHIRFRLRNLTHKRITGYEFEISDTSKGGSIFECIGDKRDWIDPDGISREFSEEFLLALYWCEGNPQIIIEIQNVLFQDGTNWDAPSSDRISEDN